MPGSTVSPSDFIITIVFSKEVQNTDSSDMVLTGNSQGAAAVSFVQVDRGNVRQWTFPISGHLDGTLYVELARDANDIEDLGGLDLSMYTWRYLNFCLVMLRLLLFMCCPCRRKQTLLLIGNNLSVFVF